MLLLHSFFNGIINYMGATKQRLRSIDIFRGITVALMILVNSIDDQQAYHWLVHSSWNGCTLADLVFPFFIFIVGVSATLSIAAQRTKGLATSQISYKIIKRTAFLFLIGLLINAFPNHFDLASIRILGVLQRIAICYFFSALLFLTTSIRTQSIVIGSVLVLYWLAMTMIPVPEFGVNHLSMEGNLAAYIDRLLIPSNHLYTKAFDPEGLLSTIPAIATALLGNVLGAWLLTSKPKTCHLRGMVFTGVIVATWGWLWGLSFPINKTIWSSSYVLWTGGIALLVFSLCYWLIEIKNWRRWSKPFELFGKNAMAAFILHVLFLKFQATIFLSNPEGDFTNLRVFLTTHLFPHASLPNASLMYALTSVGFWLAIIALRPRWNVLRLKKIEPVGLR